jgi:hypothetical protein
MLLFTFDSQLISHALPNSFSPWHAWAVRMVAWTATTILFYAAGTAGWADTLPFGHEKDD